MWGDLIVSRFYLMMNFKDLQIISLLLGPIVNPYVNCINMILFLSFLKILVSDKYVHGKNSVTYITQIVVKRDAHNWYRFTLQYISTTEYIYVASYVHIASYKM